MKLLTLQEIEDKIAQNNFYIVKYGNVAWASLAVDGCREENANLLAELSRRNVKVRKLNFGNNISDGGNNIMDTSLNND